MTQRERATSAEAEAVPRPASGYGTPPRPEYAAGTPTQATPAWENLYRTLSPEQQRELLDLAGRQGLLYAHQLPAASNGSPVDPNRRLLAGILNGALATLQPLHAEPIEAGDDGLDAAQREAVAKALATPDVLLVQGRPGTGKSRLVAEIISRATARGERVLFLAATTAGIDRVLELVVSRDCVFPIRCIDAHEQAADLPPIIRVLTFPERIRALGLEALNHARRQAEDDEQRARRLRQDEPRWAQFSELVRQAEALEAECQALERQRDQLPREIAEQADAATSAPGNGFPRGLADLAHSFKEAEIHTETRLAELRSRIETGRHEQTNLDAELQVLQPLAEAKQQKRWWKKDWWRATIRGKKTLSEWADLKERCRQAQLDLDAAQSQIAITTRQWQEAKDDFAAKRTEFIAAELARRQAELNDRLAMLRYERSVLQQKWQNHCHALSLESPRPKEMTLQEVQEAHSDWCRRLERAEAQHAFTQQWIACLERTPEVLSTCLPEYFNVVAATLTALARDKHFGGGVSEAKTEPDFDLLVIEEADQITEPQFLQVARRGRRCVLVGEPAWPQMLGPWDGERVEPPTASPPAHHFSWRSGLDQQPGGRPKVIPRAAGLDAGPAGPFQRLWQLLHCDPRHLPYVWIQEANRLCCRLRQVPPEQRQWLTSEHVADFPTIELRILAAPHSPPSLAEILFPPSFTIDRAKQYVFQELQELAVQASSSSLRWTDGRDQVILRLADRDLAHGQVIELAPGIREILGATPSPSKRPLDFKSVPQRTGTADWQTCCVEFDRSAGWDRARAAAWACEHLKLSDLGRTISLDVCYRWSGCLEFVPVPAPGRDAAGASRRNAGLGHKGPKTARATTVTPAHPRKGGAGLEIDLADSRHRERLPAELRSALPTQGFVNYQEAQAVVRTLANLLQEPDFRQGDGLTTGNQPSIAVLALYPAQAELIRRLIREDETLAALDGIVEVGVPSAFRQREAAIVLLSLTRSHTHRAVAFGQGPQMLALALTRARSRLFVFGDPGTLVRRSNWDGPVEHLDRDAAAHERQLITQLVHCLR